MGMLAYSAPHVDQRDTTFRGSVEKEITLLSFLVLFKSYIVYKHFLPSSFFLLLHRHLHPYHPSTSSPFPYASLSIPVALS